MKQLKNMFVMALAAMVLTSSATAMTKKEKPAALPVELQLAGNIQNMPLLQLVFKNNDNSSRYLVTITDENGVVLYNDQVTKGNAGKQFLLNTEDLGNATLQFEITDTKSRKSVQYRVSAAATITNKIAIEKL